MRGLLRAVRELAKRSAIGPYLGDFGPQGNNTYTKRVPLSTAELATAAGLQVARSGAAVHCHPQTHAGFRGEIYFGEDQAPGDHLWQPLSRCQISTPPDGDSFKSFRVRVRTGSNVDATNELVLVVDPAPYGSEALEAQPPTPEVGQGGSATMLMRALLRSSGTEVDLEAADGSTATRGLLGVAGVGTDAVLRGLRSTAAALADAATSGAGELLTASKLQVYDAVGLAWNMARADAGPAGTSTLRVAGATTATLVATRATAGALTGVAVAANPRRVAVLIENLDNAETVYVDTAAATVAGGVPIGPLQSKTFTTVEAINCIRGGGADVALSIADESK